MGVRFRTQPQPPIYKYQVTVLQTSQMLVVRKPHERNVKRVKTTVTKRSSGPVRATRSRAPNPYVNKSFVNVGLGFPAKLRCQLKYIETVPLVSTLGAIGTYSFSCNSLFDPNQTGGGHQPMYYDQFTALYTKYTVFASKIKATFLTTSTTNNNVAVGILLNDDLVTQGPSFSGVFEQSLAVSKYISPGATMPTLLYKQFNAYTIHGANALDNPLLTGNTGNTFISGGTDPAEQTFYTLLAQSADGVSTNSLIIAVEITYDVVFTELRDVLPS